MLAPRVDKRADIGERACGKSVQVVAEQQADVAGLVEFASFNCTVADASAARN